MVSDEIETSVEMGLPSSTIAGVDLKSWLIKYYRKSITKRLKNWSEKQEQYIFHKCEKKFSRVSSTKKNLLNSEVELIESNL